MLSDDVFAERAESLHVKLPIPIYIGISERFRCIEKMTAMSILEHTSAKVSIQLVYPEVEEGCTGFTNVRYTIRCGIYLDCDMVLLADIADLWAYRSPGNFVCLADGSTEVAVIDCEHRCRNKREEHLLPKLPSIPLKWNSEDRMVPGAKLLHFTDLSTQPWFHAHPNKEAVAIYERYRELAGQV